MNYTKFLYKKPNTTYQLKIEDDYIKTSIELIKDINKTNSLLFDNYSRLGKLILLC